MKRSGLFFLLFAYFSVKGQSPVEIFNYNRDSVPIESIYLQTNQQAYVAGEMIWFKAYLYSAYNLSIVSSNFYIELLNENNTLIHFKILPVINGTAQGSFELPDSLTQGVYLLRAYSGWTPNIAETYVFKKAIPVFNPFKKTTIVSVKRSAGYTCVFYFESGVPVINLPAKVVLKCTTADKKPVKAAGSFFDSKGNDLGVFSTNKDGLCMLSYTPVKGVKYFVELQFTDNTIKKIELPSAADNGVVLAVEDDEQGKYFTLLSSEMVPENLKEITLLAVMQDNVVFEKKLKTDQPEQSGIINTSALPPGLLRFFLLDKNSKPVISRNVFVNADALSLPGELKISKPDFSKKAFNEISLTLPDSLTGNFSLSVTDADAHSMMGSDNIISGLLLQPGTKEPAGPILSNFSKDDYDLFALTSSWETGFTKKEKKFKEEAFITVNGKVEGAKKTEVGDKINFIIETKDSSRTYFTVPIAADGSFKLSNLIYEDSARMLYKVASSNNSYQTLTIDPDKTVTTEYARLWENMNSAPWIEPMQAVFADTTKEEKIKEIAQNVSSFDKGKDLQEVVVKTKKLTSTQEVNKKYTSGLFRNAPGSRTLDLINEPPRSGALNIFEYLKGKVPGLRIDYDILRKKYYIESSRSISTRDLLEGGNGVVDGKIFLNEIEVDAEMVTQISVNQIALVKFFPGGSAQFSGAGISSVLAVYTKKPDDYKKANEIDYSNSFWYPGYSVNKTFSGPDYSKEDKIKPDYRTTLFWEPNFILDGSTNEIKIRFYNSDVAKRFRLVLEGITDDGRPVHFEKIINQ